MAGGLTWLVMLHGVVDNQVKSGKGRRRPVFECRASELGEYIFKLPTVMFHSLQRLHYILASFSSAGVITQEVGGRVSLSANFHGGSP